MAFITEGVKLWGVLYSNVCKIFRAPAESVLAARWRCENCVTVCLYEIRLLLRLKGVQSRRWLPSASEEEWRLITNVIFDVCDSSGESWSEYLKSGYVDLPALIFLFTSAISACVRVRMGFVCKCRYFWVRQFNFLFQLVIICSMKKKRCY